MRPHILARLPVRYQWTLHNLVGHPLCELASLAGLASLSDRIHDGTAPRVADPPAAWSRLDVAVELEACGNSGQVAMVCARLRQLDGDLDTVCPACGGYLYTTGRCMRCRHGHS